MNRIPLEVLLQIASHLDTHSCFVCRNVCHLWAEAFIPFCWHTLDQLRSPWKLVLRSPGPSKTPEEQEQWTMRLRSLLRRYGSHVKEIIIRDDALLDAVIKARLSRLESLTICGIVNRYVCDQESAFMAVEQQQPVNSLTSLTPADADISMLESWPQLPSRLLFDTGIPKQCLMSRTQGCWQLIMNNPGLRHLEFKSQAGYTLFPLMSFPLSTTLISAISATFLDSVLARLPHLTHLAIEQPAADHVFRNLGTRYHNITSFVYPNTVEFGNGILSTTVGSTTLRRLKLQERIEARNLVELGQKFPELRELSLSSLQIYAYYQYTPPPPLDDNVNVNGDYINRITGVSKEAPLLSKLEYLFISNIFDITSISRAGIKLPALKRIDPTIKFRTLAYLWVILKAFPTLAYLDAMETHSTDARYGDALDPASVKPSSRLHLKTLILSHGSARFGAGVGGMLEVMPMLTRLELGFVPASALASMARNCKHLEHLRFNVAQGEGHKELNLIFEACSKLRICRGKGHEILAEDFVHNHSWTCLDLQELDLKIVSVPRMTLAQECVWDAMRQDGRSNAKTLEEKEAVARRELSHQFQRSIYKTLAKYVNLRHFNLGGPESIQSAKEGVLTGANHTTTPDCLELTMESGLLELARLSRMETLGVGGLSHRMSTQDLMWMCERWPLKKVSGIEYLRSDPSEQLKTDKDLLDRVKINMMISELTVNNRSLSPSHRRL
ncbi:hypothetical protein BGZ95_006418 [Linnemannia exigua]|uniref:F-box domain-containing protein n=1 Tax=Linnemannia exigua TaxID=604196 RepID=A0AAD4DPD8_9FUNG|nr:hypothetical protein BGZ95_006418 [Linnemannia exigua]